MIHGLSQVFHGIFMKLHLVVGPLASELRNCGSCVVYIQKDGAMLLVGAW